MRAAIAIGWGVKSGGERMAVGAGGAMLIPPEVRHRARDQTASPHEIEQADPRSGNTLITFSRPW